MTQELQSESEVSTPLPLAIIGEIVGWVLTMFAFGAVCLPITFTVMVCLLGLSRLLDVAAPTIVIVVVSYPITGMILTIFASPQTEE